MFCFPWGADVALSDMGGLWIMCGQLQGGRDGDEVVGALLWAVLPTQIGMKAGRWSWSVWFRRSTWSSACRGESEQLWPAPEGPGRYSDRIHGCPPR